MKFFGPIAKLLTFTLAAVFLYGCHGGNKIETASNPANTPSKSSPTPASDFERTLQFIRQGNFAHIYVFSRKDGAPIDREDAALLHKPEMKFVDVVATDDKKHAIAGTNFDLDQANLEALHKRFTIEDYTGK